MMLGERRFTMERNWVKAASCPIKLYSHEHTDVHRIKADEDVGIVITTHADGGLVVRDMGTDEVLWGLPRVSRLLSSINDKLTPP